MSETNHAPAERHQERFPVSVVVEDSVKLQGETVNWSSTGCLMEATGRIVVQVTIEGNTYRGWLVRAVPGDSGTTAYGIQLLDPLMLSKPA